MEGESHKHTREREIEEVRREEASRGTKKPFDSEALARKRAEQQRLRALLEDGTEEEFSAAIIARGLQRGSPEYGRAMSAYHALRRQLRTRS